MGAAVATIMVSAERVKEKEAVPEVPAAGPRLHRNIWAQPAPRFPTYDPVAQRARTRQELVKFEKQNKVAAEIVPIGAGPDTFVLWERGCQELENMMLDQLTYVDAAIAEAESFAANMG